MTIFGEQIALAVRPDEGFFERIVAAVKTAENVSDRMTQPFERTDGKRTVLSRSAHFRNFDFRGPRCG